MELTTDRESYKNDDVINFGRPKICGTFSIGPARNYISDNSQLKFLRGLPDSDTIYDLNRNVVKTIASIQKEERLEFLCHYLRDYQEPINVFDKSPVSLEDTPFISYRGFLREMSSNSYQSAEPHRISVSLFRGVIYMHMLDYPYMKQRREKPDEKESKCYAWGFKFGQYLLSDKSNTEPGMESSLNESGDFCCVYETKLNNHRLIYAAEMDGLLCNKSDDISKSELTPEVLRNCKFVELKTLQHIKTSTRRYKFRRYTTKRWWLQSLFVGGKTILCGFRDDNGIVNKLNYYNVSDLPRISKTYWHPNVCINFCDGFLTFVKKCLARELQQRHGECPDDISNLPKVDLLFERYPESNVKLRAQPSDEDISVIPQWYVDLFPDL